MLTSRCRKHTINRIHNLWIHRRTPINLLNTQTPCRIKDPLQSWHTFIFFMCNRVNATILHVSITLVTVIFLSHASDSPTAQKMTNRNLRNSQNNPSAGYADITFKRCFQTFSDVMIVLSTRLPSHDVVEEKASPVDHKAKQTQKKNNTTYLWSLCKHYITILLTHFVCKN